MADFLLKIILCPVIGDRLFANQGMGKVNGAGNFKTGFRQNHHRFVLVLNLNGFFDNDKMFGRMEAIVLSMTKAERRDPDIIDGSQDVLYLNKTDAKSDSSRPLPDSSIFYIGGATSLNILNNNYICYAFHSVAGFSKFGSHADNGQSIVHPRCEVVGGVLANDCAALLSTFFKEKRD